MPDTPTGVSSGGSNGFFSQMASTVAEGLGEGLSTIGRDILPVWTANELGLQTQDQLSDSTFSRPQSPPRVDSPTTQTSEQGGESPGVFGVDTQTLLIIGAAALAGLLLARMT